MKHTLKLALAVLLIPTISAVAKPGHVEAVDEDISNVSVSGVITYTITSGSFISTQMELDFLGVTRGIGSCFSGITMAVPPDTSVVSSSGYGVERTGRQVPEETTRVRFAKFPDDTYHLKMIVAFPNCLGVGDTVHMSLAIHIPGAPPRSSNPVRASEGVAVFNMLGLSSVTGVTMEVVVPEGFTAQPPEDEWQSVEEGGVTRYILEHPTSQTQPLARFVAENDATRAKVDIKTAGRSFTLRAWAGDSEWSSFVGDGITVGVPALEELIGVEWPVRETVEVIETATLAADGLAGTFDASERRIALSEALDPVVLQHELAHGWFNDQWFAERWLIEGLAQEYAALSADALGATAPPPRMVSPGDTNRIALAEWRSDAAAGQVAYAYNASYAVIHKITSEIGADKMRDVLTAIAGGRTAYGGQRAASELVDWRQFLDLVETIGGSARAADLVAAYVADGAHAVLEERADLRRDYAALVERGGDWNPPAGLVRAMETWEFEQARTLLDEAAGVLDLRDATLAVQSDDPTPLPDSVRTAYSSAEHSLAEVHQQVASFLDASRVLARASAATARSHGLLTSVGLLGEDLNADLGHARTALAQGDSKRATDLSQAIISTRAEAGNSGLLRIGAAMLLAAVATGAVIWTRRRRSKASASHGGIPSNAVDGAEVGDKHDCAVVTAQQASPSEQRSAEASRRTDDEDTQ